MLGEVVYATWQDFLLAAEEATNLDHAVLSLTANRTMAESALNAPRAGWGDEELYKRFPVKAAVLLQRLISNPSFARWQQKNRASHYDLFCTSQWV